MIESQAPEEEDVESYADDRSIAAEASETMRRPQQQPIQKQRRTPQTATKDR